VTWYTNGITLPTHSRKSRFSDTLSILHLSDLHFSAEADERADESIHCTERTEKLGTIIAGLRPDLVIVSGDLSDRGDRESLLRVREYLFGSYAVSGTKRVGLSLPAERVRILAGNHDAFNMLPNGTARDRVQRALQNFVDVFPEFVTGPCNCSYEWVEGRSWDAYLSFADSCFVGDPDWEHNKPKGVPFLETTAKGKLSNEQATKLLQWSDWARDGKLLIEDQPVPAGRFLRSLKILIMHHYLFEPKHHRSDPTMRFVDQHDVFRNVGLADFDMLLCGHKHVPDFEKHTYGYHMGDRGRWRYAFNCLRRSIGQSSLPVGTYQLAKKTPTQYLRFLFNSVIVVGRSSNNVRQMSPRTFEAELELLGLAITDPKDFEKQILAVIAEMRNASEFHLDPAECKQLASAVEDRFSAANRAQLAKEMELVGRKLASSFHKRPFIQALAGSATKRATRKDSRRGFFFHEITASDEGYEIGARIFEWNSEKKEFIDQGKKFHQIPFDRHP